MGAFYVNCCVKGAKQAEILAHLRQNGRTGYVGPTENGWTAVVAEDLERQDWGTIQAYGQSLTHESDNVAVFFVCHDEDVLIVRLFKAGEEVGKFDSDPSYFRDPGEFDPKTMSFSKPPPTEDETKPVLSGAHAFASAFELGEEAIAGLLPKVYDNAIVGTEDVREVEHDPEMNAMPRVVLEGILELHGRWSDTLGLPAYAVGMGFRSVASGDSDVDWAQT